ncbi:protein terminal ear1 [Momordica charantia]|uniref:Protein terminal ear1 n=1 Tax=Momordica charantia TaxID=3673 RepID=A0A6J1CJE0_MOMCH|nr:protein terminal ear1 [Momordica charantia]
MGMDHHLNNPPLPFPFFPSPSFSFFHHRPLMAFPSKPLNPNADPFLSPPTPPPPPHVGGSLVSAYGNIYYPRAGAGFYLQFHPYPAVNYYDPLSSQLFWPPYQAAGFGGAAVQDPKHGFQKNFMISSGPRPGDIKPSPQWVEKNGGGGGGGGDPVDGSGVTTVMIKNIPNQLKRRDLLQLLDRYCQVVNQKRDSKPDFSAAEYDFVYLPMDFRRSWFEGKVSNLGYAFVNFTTSIAASQFCTVYHNYKWDVNVNKKICEVTDARIQGKEALTNAFKNKIFWCCTDQYLPVMLTPASNGFRRYRRVNVGKRIPRVPRKPLKKLCK